MPAWLGLGLVLVAAAGGCLMRGNDQLDGGLRPGGRLEPFGAVYAGKNPPAAPERPCTEALSRKAVAESLDAHNLLYSGRMVSDCDPGLLAVPEHLAAAAGRDFTMALTPPEIDFAVIPVEPRWPRVYHNQYRSGWWGNYCQPAYDPASGKFYSAVADHGARDAHLYLVEYDPRARQVNCLAEYNHSVGRGARDFGDGIIHGWMDFFQAPGMPRPQIWFCSYWAKFPEPSEADYATGYDGGHIVSYDPADNLFVDYGAPLPRTSWPFHHLDAGRGMLYAVSFRNEFLAWNIRRQRAEWAGYLPAGMLWNNRAILVDANSGCVFTSNDDPGDRQRRLICYNDADKRFSLLDCHMPSNPASGTFDRLRGHTRERGPDGLFWAATESGALFTFDPDRREIKPRGLNWPGPAGTRRSTTTMARSPQGRYLYYNIMSYQDGSPVIQYDTRTDTRKVLAFLYPYYHAKYGYIPTGSYSFALDERGAGLFMVWNGAFIQPAPNIGVDFWGHCSVMYMKIPESERME